MEKSEKNLLLDELSVCYNRINYLKTLCEEQNQPEEAAKFERRKARLKLEIDGLSRDLFDDWLGSAAELKESLKANNVSLQKAVKDIEKSVKLAQNIAKALGCVDDAIKVAADLVT